MSKYFIPHVDRLRKEAEGRMADLRAALRTSHVKFDDVIEVDGIRIRLAVEGFKAILAEIRKLK